MKSFKTKTTLDFRALKVANLYVMRVKKKTPIVFGVLGLICFGAAVWSFLTPDNMVLGFIFILLGGYSIVSVITEEKKVDQSLKKYFSTNPAMTQYIGLDENNVTICVRAGETLQKAQYDWAYVQEANVLKDYIMLFLNGGVPVIINRNEESMIEGSLSELEELIKEKCEYKPYKVYDKALYKKDVDPIEYIVNDFEENIDEIIEKLNEVEVEPTPEAEVTEAEVVEEIDAPEAVETEEAKETIE